MKILVAEDDRLSRRVLEKFLTNWGYEVCCVEDGNKAWEQLNADTDLHLAVLDWIMPGFKGIELCQKIREELTERQCYIILLTGKTEKQDIVEGFEAGADDYIVKPFNPLELQSRVKVGGRLIESRLLLQEKNKELEQYASDMERLAEERAKMLIHADRLASLGTLTAGVAHEINNPTTFISGNAQTLERCWPIMEAALLRELERNPDGPKKTTLVLKEFPNMIDGIRNGVKRINAITKGLKTFSRVGKNTFEPFQVNDCIEQALLLCSNRLKRGVEVLKHLETDLPRVVGDSQKLEQVFVNLCVNAMDAIEEHLTIQEKRLTIRTFTKDHHIIVTFEDTGPGIKPEVLEKLWQPFFTTKAAGKGTGLGLAISQGIVHDHDGEITVENNPQQGAVFTITLPIMKD